MPKGPSTDARERRLAAPTEDHPLAYSDFQGVIPKDEYGGGTILIWDRGSYCSLKEAEEGDKEPKPAAQQIEDGHVTIWVNGQKIAGGYALIRTSRGDDARWLLVKMKDDEADARRNPTSTGPVSVKTGRSLDEIRDREGGQKDE